MSIRPVEDAGNCAFYGPASNDEDAVNKQALNDRSCLPNFLAR